MKSQTIKFANDAGLELAALLDLPDAESPRAYALFAHCFTCNKNYKSAFYLAQALCRERLAVLRFDFAGLGESEGDFAETSLSANIADLVAAARYLEARHAPPRILIGHSLGGAAVLRAASSLPSVRAVVTLATPFDPTAIEEHLAGARQRAERDGQAEVEVGGRAFILKRQFFEDLTQQRPAETLRQLGRPLLVMHSPQDRTVSIDNAARIYRAARHPKSFISLDRADHLLSDEADARYAGRLIAVWAERYLDAEAPGSA